jgi:alkyldihydroxyacetonephosphate synthase
MKWAGWGREDVVFSHEDKPGLGPFLLKAVGIDVRRPVAPVPAFASLDIPSSRLPAELRDGLEAILGAAGVSTEARDRVLHARGKSLPDLVRHRRGDLGRIPDVVVRPGSEEEIAAVLRLVLDADAVLIPFGGGTNISGSLEAMEDEVRPIVSLDLARLDRVLEIDEMSRLATVQAGVFGPALEAQLAARGWTLGHFPDSFTHSTLGGWIATRSSGMQSDKYGDAADFTRGLRAVTPGGVLAIRPVPSTSTGPSVREMMLGSEGRLGIITEATVHVHRVPQQRVILGYLLPTWAISLEVMRAIAASEATPSVTRVSDPPETVFSFATRKTPSLLDRVKSRALQALLRHRRIDPEQMCLAFIGYEGTPRHVAGERRLVEAVVKEHGGVALGRSPGELYDQKKFDTPYIRDFLLDRGALADVSETSAPWSALPALYDGAMGAARGAFARLGVHGYVMCHLSHSYHAGACLYFTFAFGAAGVEDELAAYRTVKSAVQQSFLDAGATLSHHHAVGTEHAPWLEQDISPAGVAMVRALLAGVDPGQNLNPAKIVDAPVPADVAGPTARFGAPEG